MWPPTRCETCAGPGRAVLLSQGLHDYPARRQPALARRCCRRCCCCCSGARRGTGRRPPAVPVQVHSMTQASGGELASLAAATLKLHAAARLPIAQPPPSASGSLFLRSGARDQNALDRQITVTLGQNSRARSQRDPANFHLVAPLPGTSFRLVRGAEICCAPRTLPSLNPRSPACCVLPVAT